MLESLNRERRCNNSLCFSQSLKRNRRASRVCHSTTVNINHFTWTSFLFFPDEELSHALLMAPIPSFMKQNRPTHLQIITLFFSVLRECLFQFKQSAMGDVKVYFLDVLTLLKSVLIKNVILLTKCQISKHTY